MPGHLRTVLALTLLAALPACAGRSGSSSPRPDSRTLSKSEEAIRQNIATLYQRVATRKASWLR